MRKDLLKNVIDVRTRIDYDDFHYPSSINIPRLTLLSDPSLYLNKKNTYYLICDKGLVSASCANVLNLLGYHCISIAGGLEEYKKQNKIS